MPRYRRARMQDQPVNRPLVSVVMPTRNRCALALRALEALAAQTHPSYEVIVVDDNSTDDTPRTLQQFATDHPDFCFRFLRNEPQRGANPSRNRAIRESRGEFVAFLDDDCIAAPDWIEKLMAGFVSGKVGAVTGRVDDPAPTNIYELTFKGTHRVDGRTHATRLIAGNMCIRRTLLDRFALDEDRAAVQGDTSVSGRGDEEGLYLLLAAAGWEVRVAPDAAVMHEHHYSRRTFFRQAYRGGRSAARVGYKYHLPPRIELMPLFLTYLFLPLCAVGAWWWMAPALPACFFLAAIVYNELFRKRKTLGELLVVFPVLLAYYHCRMAGYVLQFARLLTGAERIARVRPEEAIKTGEQSEPRP